MRLVAWNLGHQTQERELHARLVNAIACLKPDVLVLNEYVHGHKRLSLLDELSKIGLRQHAVSRRVGKNNQVLIASRVAFDGGELVGPTTADGGGESNFLHVRFRKPDFELVGMRVPAYEDGATLAEYWESFVELTSAVADRPIVFIGDLNADPAQSKHAGSKFLNRLQAEQGWRIPAPKGDWSFRKGTRIDHALVSPSLAVKGAEYVREIDGEVLCSADQRAMSDHAPIVVDIDIAAKAGPVDSQGRSAASAIGSSANH